MRMLTEVIAWLHLLPWLAGVILCAVCSSRSRWAWLLLGGFALQLLVTATSRVGVSLIGRGVLEYGRLESVFAVFSLLGLLASIGIVAGVAGLLSDLGSRSRQAA